MKIPESSVSVPAILSEIALKVSIPSEDLVILDSKYMSQMIKVSMHAKFNIVILVNMYLYHSTTDLEYWKAPSRRLYVAKRDEYDELRKQKTKNQLSLGRKMKVDLTEERCPGLPTKA